MRTPDPDIENETFLLRIRGVRGSPVKRCHQHLRGLDESWNQVHLGSKFDSNIPRTLKCGVLRKLWYFLGKKLISLYWLRKGREKEEDDGWKIHCVYRKNARPNQERTGSIDYTLIHP